MIHTIPNDRIAVWHDGVWLRRVFVERIMGRGDNTLRVLLSEVLSKDEANFLLSFPKHSSLFATHYCGRPDVLYQEDVIASFSNCVVVRHWIPSVMAHTSDDAQSLRLWVDVDCTGVVWLP